MSLANFVTGASWRCPFCHTEQHAEIEIDYGLCNQKRYRLGDHIEWTGPIGQVYEERLPGGNGRIIGTAQCSNNWWSRWIPSKYPDRNVPLDRPLGPLPPLEERKRLGCPFRVRVLVTLEGDTIKGIAFSGNPDDNIQGEW